MEKRTTFDIYIEIVDIIIVINMTRKIDTDELVKKYQEGCSMSELSRYFNCGDNTIRRRFKKLEFSSNRERIASKSKEWFIDKYINQKWSANKIAKEIRRYLIKENETFSHINP